MSYSLIKKYNWTYFAEKILNAMTGSKNTYMANLAAGTTTNLPIAFRTVSIMNSHATNTISIANVAADSITIPALTTVNFDAVQGSLFSGDLTITTGTGTAIVAGTY
jgi:hypothetical protein|tara:strand:- start:12 stop:332 length:321 start_codon:yes stop_codon:yes gene_type:complete